MNARPVLRTAIAVLLPSLFGTSAAVALPLLSPYARDLGGSALPCLGLAIGLLLAARDRTPEHGTAAAMLRLGAALVLCIVAWLLAHPVLAFIPRLWVSAAETMPVTPPTDGGWAAHDLFAVPRMLAAFKGAVLGFLDRYRDWVLVQGCPAAVVLFAVFLFQEELIRRPLRDLTGASDRDTKEGPWRGGWLEAARVRQLASNRTGVPLGLSGGRLLRYRPYPEQGWLGGHHMVIAGTRGGKGVSCVIPAILDHNGPVLVLDIKGENLAVCRRHRASLGRRQVVLNPFGLIDSQTDRFDPLTYLRLGPMLLRDITTLVEGLVRPEPAAETAWISNAARDLLEAAIELIVTQEDEAAQRTLLAVVDLVLAPERLDTFEAWTRAGSLCSGRIARAGAKLLTMGDRQRGAVLDCLAENLAWLKYDQVRDMLNTSSGFQLDDLLDNRADLWIVVPQDLVERLGNLLRLMTTLALGAVTRQDGKRRVMRPVLAVLDEFTRLGRLEKAIEIATIAAGGGVEALFVVQDKGTLDAVYGDKGAATLLGACATVRVFALGRADDHTARWAEAQMPFRTMLRESSDNPGAGAAKVNGRLRSSRAETKERLMDGPTIQEMPPGRMVCLIRSQAPLLLERIVSHRHPAYSRRLDPNPVVMVTSGV